MTASGSRRIGSGSRLSINRFSLAFGGRANSVVVRAAQALTPLEAENAELREQAVELALQIQRLREDRSSA
jgi:hypothetical protein